MPAYDRCCEWGAVARGATVLPYRWRDDSAADFARSQGALLAARRSAEGYSLAPASLTTLPPGTALVLPSPNGSTLCTMAKLAAVFTACLRNCAAVAEQARQYGVRIAVIPAGEQWRDGSLRLAIEDLIGAGAVLAHLPGRLSPEAEMAIAVFERFRHSLQDTLARCRSGRELLERGFPDDVELAAELGASSAAPLLRDGRFGNAAG